MNALIFICSQQALGVDGDPAFVAVSAATGLPGCRPTFFNNSPPDDALVGPEGLSTPDAFAWPTVEQ